MQKIIFVSHVLFFTHRMLQWFIIGDDETQFLFPITGFSFTRYCRGWKTL